MNAIKHLASDLAPGDSSSITFDWTQYDVRRVGSTQDPLFELAYENLWAEFGPKGEIEEKSVFAQRLKWDPSEFVKDPKSDSDYSLKYEIIVATQNGKFAAVRDHSVIIMRSNRRGNNQDNSRRKPPHAVVHLSHVLIDPAHRGSGMAGWLRAWPIQTVRECLLASGSPENTPISLVAEMEPYLFGNTQEKSIDTGARFKSYRRAGYQMMNPLQVSYHQPDFSNPDIIDTNGGPHPLLLRLVLRRVGKETEATLSGAEVRETVSALYHMYELAFRSQDMAPIWEQMKNTYPPDEAQVKLLEPGMDPDREFCGEP